jgi:hypothetical protein
VFFYKKIRILFSQMWLELFVSRDLLPGFHFWWETVFQVPFAQSMEQRISLACGIHIWIPCWNWLYVFNQFYFGSKNYGSKRSSGIQKDIERA